MPLSLSPSANLAANVSNAAQEVQSTPSDPALSSSLPAGNVNSADILKGEKAVAIHHHGMTYRLQATRLGKLILTK